MGPYRPLKSGKCSGKTHFSPQPWFDMSDRGMHEVHGETPSTTRFLKLAHRCEIRATRVTIMYANKNPSWGSHPNHAKSQGLLLKKPFEPQESRTQHINFLGSKSGWQLDGPKWLQAIVSSYDLDQFSLPSSPGQPGTAQSGEKEEKKEKPRAARKFWGQSRDNVK